MENYISTVAQSQNIDLKQMNILITTAGHKLNSFHLTVMNVMTTRKTLVNHLFATPEGAFVKDGM